MISENIGAKNTARMSLAVKCAREGNLAAADALCRNVLDGEPRNALAWNLLGAIAVQLRLFDKAVEFFRVARDNGLAEAHANFQHALEDSAAAPPLALRDKRFLLIKAWGAGFWSDVSHVLGGLLLAELTDRTPVVHWGRNSRFGDGTDGDAFGFFFEPVSPMTIHDLMQLDGADFYPRKWQAGNLLNEDNAKWFGQGARLDAIYYLNRPENVLIADFYISIASLAPWLPSRHPLAKLATPDLYRHIIKKYFRPRSFILAEAEAFFTEKLSATPFIAAHIRGSDKATEYKQSTSSEDFVAHVAGEVYKLLDKIPSGYRIFLMTEDERVARETVRRYGERIVMTHCQRSRDERGPHFLETVDHQRLGVEVMTDVILALQAEAFIGIGGSNVAAMVALMRDWPPGRCVLLGPSVLLRRPSTFYIDDEFRDLEMPDNY